MAEEEESEVALVFDNGSGTMKCGFSGDVAPHRVFPTIVGRSRSSPENVAGPPPVLVGQEALAQRGALTLHYPLEHGVITSWDDMEKVWHHAFYNELRVAPEEHATLVTESFSSRFGPKSQREKTTQVMFETFKVPAFYSALSETLSLYASGRVNGVVLGSGDGITCSVPHFNGWTLTGGVQRMGLGGRDLTAYMVRMLNCCPTMRNAARDIKEKLCYVALDFDEAMKSASQDAALPKAYELPDGREIKVAAERFRCAEVLFQPNLIGKHSDGIADLIHCSLQRIDVETASDLSKNIVLSGGNTMFPGIVERLSKELTAKTSGSVKVVADPERKYYAWIGGSVLASLSTFQDMWIRKEEYDACGPGIIHRKCY